MLFSARYGVINKADLRFSSNRGACEVAIADTAFVEREKVAILSVLTQIT